MTNSDNPTLQMIDCFISGIKEGEANHGYSLCQMLLSEGPNIDPETLVLITEGVLELSVLAGSDIAKDYLAEQWPILKKNHINRLARKK
jgi:hypothetical protein